jgi:hypothetical protein
MFRDVKTDFGAAGNGTTNDRTAFSNADTTAPQGTLYVPRGTYRISSNLTLASDIRFEEGAMLKPDGGVTVTLNGNLDARLQRIVDVIAGGALRLSGKVPEVRPEWWGAAGDGTTDDAPEIQIAMQEAANVGATLLLAARTYYLGSTLVIPFVYSGAGNTLSSMNFEIRGTWMHSAEKGRPPRGTVLLTGTESSNWTALKTPDLTSPNTTSGWWHNFITISNLYLKGSTSPATHPPASVAGLDLRGIFIARLHNIHSEGYSVGIRCRDGSEIYNTGLIMVENCYYGVEVIRTPSAPPQYWDMQIWFENLLTINNQVNLVLDNPRSVFINGGENISLAGPTAARPRIVIRNCGWDTQIHIRRYVLENHAINGVSEIPIQVDSNGVGMLTIDELNLATATSSALIKCDGYFDTIAVRDSAFPNAVLDEVSNPAFQQPLISLNASGDKPFARGGNIEVRGNLPSAVNAWVARNGSRDPLGDVVPPEFQQVNGRPEMDQGNDNRTTLLRASGATTGHGWTTSNPLTGNARLYWSPGTPSSDKGYVRAFFPRPLFGVQTLYVSCVLDDDNGNVIPQVNTILTKTGQISRFSSEFLAPICPLETYVLGSGGSQRTFRRYVISVVLIKQGGPNTGLTGLDLSNIHDGGVNSGLESLSVYFDTREAGQVAIQPRMTSAAPAAASGYVSRGEVMLSADPGTLGYVGWVGTAAGIPGSGGAVARFGAVVP